jgi:Na+/proline symporter
MVGATAFMTQFSAWTFTGAAGKASDFLQMVVIMAVSVVAAIVAMIRSDGLVPIFQNGLPDSGPFGSGYNYVGLLIVWVIASFSKQFLRTNNMIDSYRYMCTKDTKNARKAALLACGLMLIGPFIWFIPDWFVAANYSNTDLWNLANLGKSIKDATYYIFVKNELPAGMVGLMISAMFAATMSSMNSALNRNAGIFVRNFYKVVINKSADEKKMLKVGQIATFAFGAVIIATGVFLNSLKNTNLFNMTMMVSSLLALPILIPSLLGFFVKKTPDWAAWATILVGGLVSAFVAFVVTPEMIQNFLHLPTPLTSREFKSPQPTFYRRIATTDCSHSTITSHIKGKHLSYEERVLIQIRLKDNYSIRAVAREIGCSPSTVSNEMARGSVTLYNGHVTRYKASAGQKAYDNNRKQSCRHYDFLSRSAFLEYVLKHFTEDG